MSKSIRISDELASLAEAEAPLAHRSPPQQVEHWAMIGRALEPALSYDMQRRLKGAGRSELDAALAEVSSEESQRRTQEIIRRTAGKIESDD